MQPHCARLRQVQKAVRQEREAEMTMAARTVVPGMVRKEVVLLAGVATVVAWTATAEGPVAATGVPVAPMGAGHRAGEWDAYTGC